jgi:IclR family acetate operon transcriptional repressor
VDLLVRLHQGDGKGEPVRRNEFNIDPTWTSPPPAYHIASVGRALTLLSAVAERHQLTVSEASDLLGVAPSTAHRMLQMLVHHGFVIHADDRSYLRGPALTALAAAAQRSEIERVALPRLTALRDELPEGTVHLVALEGNGGRFVAGVQSRGEPGLAGSHVGWLLPAHTLAGGRALLARLSRHEIDSLYPDGLPITRYSHIRSMDQLRAVLRDVRTRGYAVSREAHRNVCAMGVALPAEAGASTMAVSVGWPDTAFPRHRAQHALHLINDTADELAEAFAEALG